MEKFMTIREELEVLIETTGERQLAAKLGKMPHIMSVLQPCHGAKVPEKLYNYLNPNAVRVCQFGNDRNFVSFPDGYKNCGKAGTCRCTKNAVSNSVTAAKKLVTPAQQQLTNAIRAATNIATYGVANIGQTPHARRMHAAFYADKGKVALATAKGKATRLARYGDENYSNRKKAAKTFKKRYGSDWWAKRLNNPHIVTLHDRDELEKLFDQFTIQEIATMLDVKPSTVCRNLNSMGLRDPFKSSEEMEVVRFLTNIGVTKIVRNSRSLLGNRKEIDIFLPDYGIAIEYNGVHWHHTEIDHMYDMYHRDKFLDAENKEIKLISLFSSVWHAKKPTVKMELLNALGLNDDKADLVDCELVIVTDQDASDFHETYNVLGYAGGTLHYGLISNDEIISVMSFTVTGSVLELTRYSYNTVVDGGASAMLDQCIFDANPSTIFSYTDNEWLRGDMMSELGFTMIEDVDPVCWYLSDRSSILYKTESEFEIEFEAASATSKPKMKSVWSCGSRKWELVI
jgi:hypothetical protein